MGNENAAIQHPMDPGGQFAERWTSGYHIIGNPRHRLDEQRNGTLWVDERLESLDHPPPVVDQDGDFRDAAAGCITAGGLDIDNGVLDRGLLHISKYTKIVSRCVSIYFF